MDLGTIIGVFLGLFMVLFGIISSSAGLGIYWNAPSVLIVIGGSFGALMVANPLNRMLAIVRYINLTLLVPNYE